MKFRIQNFQYSLRIVGFCDTPSAAQNNFSGNLSVFPANRGVLRLPKRASKLLCPLTLSVFPANRGVLRHRIQMHLPDVSDSFSIPCESWGSATFKISPHEVLEEWSFQYSLRIVGFCDETGLVERIQCTMLSVFPANRGVLRP